MGKKKATASPELLKTLEAIDKHAAENPLPAAPKTFQVFERMTAMRSQIRPHEANPRVIDQHAAKKLRQGVKSFGLVTAIIVNRRDSANGFPQSQHGQLVIVGGHQRCASMDALAGYNPETHENDYQIPIDVVSVPSGKEKELLVFLNNQAAQGSFDYGLLSDLITSPDVDPLAFGFDRLELSQFLDSGIIEQIFPGKPSPQAAAEAPVLDAIAEIAAGSKQYQKQQAPIPPNSSQVSSNPIENSPGTAVPPAPADDINSVENIKGRRYDFRDKTAEAGDSSHILTIVANSGAELSSFLDLIGLATADAFIDLSRFVAAIDSVAGTSFDEELRHTGDEAEDIAADLDSDLQDSAEPS